jgi:folate-binding protein YgfZ
LTDLPLAAVHSQLGAHPARIGDLEVPGHYGDPEAECHALRETCGLVDRSWVSRLELCGADRARFLNGLVTSDVESLEPGSGIYGFFTDLKGRVLADVWVMILEDRFWLELPPGTRDEIRAHLEKYVVADRVEIQALEDMLPLTLAGPDAFDFLEDRGAILPDAVGRNTLIEISGTQMLASRRRLFGLRAVTLWVSSGIADEVWSDWVSEAGGGVRPVGLEALESLRIEAGVGRWGKDYGPLNLPQETGAISEAVDFEKGCYLGQEIVARLHYLGKPRRLLQQLSIWGVDEVNEDADLYSQGERVGTLTSVARSSTDSSWLALSVLPRKVLEGRARLELEDGREVSIR